jgi:HAD superfamily hydrolase (TIGR01458 family)
VGVEAAGTVIVTVVVCVPRAHRQTVARLHADARAADLPPGSTGLGRLWENAPVACILLDVDGVLHVSGDPIPGAAEAVARLRRQGHSLRFVTNNSTRPRTTLAEELRTLGFELDDDELQTTARAAARELAGKRVFALVMGALVPDLEGIELVGDHADAVLLGGCDETTEPNQVFSWMNLGRAFAELQMGAELYCLHKNKWWQTSRGPLLDAGAFVAGLEYATGVDATVLGKPSPAYFAAALDALGAEPELTWMVTDDIDADIRGAQSFGMRTALVRTGKFRPETLEGSGLVPEIVLSSVAQLPDWLERSL